MLRKRNTGLKPEFLIDSLQSAYWHFFRSMPSNFCCCCFYFRQNCSSILILSLVSGCVLKSEEAKFIIPCENA